MNQKLNCSARIRTLNKNLEVLSQQGNQTANQLYTNFTEEFKKLDFRLDVMVNNFLGKYEGIYMAITGDRK